MTKARRRRTNTRGVAVDIKSAETAVASLYRSRGAPAAGPPLRWLAVRSPRHLPTAAEHEREPPQVTPRTTRGCRPCGFGALTRADDRDLISRECCPRPAGDAFPQRLNADEVSATPEDDVVRVADGKPVHDAGGCLKWHSPLSRSSQTRAVASLLPVTATGTPSSWVQATASTGPEAAPRALPPAVDAP